MMITPQIKADKLAKKIGLPSALYLKREDRHPLGSHKGRSLPYMITHYARAGARAFVLSSSGNAALAAALFIKKYNRRTRRPLTLKIFIGRKIEAGKLKKLKKFSDKNISVARTANPKQSAFQMDKNGRAKNLRQATDGAALKGYAELARELKKIKNLSAVFIPTSSGTTAAGLFAAWKKSGHLPAIHIIQTRSCHPIADAVNGRVTDRAAASLAGAIVDKVAPRKNEVAKIVKTSRGEAWIATDQDIKNAIRLTKKNEKIKISANSALAVAGLQLAIKTGRKFPGPVACLITGD